MFFPRCTRRHPRNECPLESTEVCSICEENHSIDKCPFLPRFKSMYQGAEVVTKQTYYINQRRLHGPRPYQQGMQGTSQAYYNPNQVTSIPSWAPPCSSFLVHASSFVLHISILFPTSCSSISPLCLATTLVECTSLGVEAPVQLSSSSFAFTTYSTATIASYSSKATPNAYLAKPEPEK